MDNAVDDRDNGMGGGLLGRVFRSLRHRWNHYSEERRLAPLYSPDASNLDIDAHISAAVDWLERAQDAGTDRGVSYGVQFGSDWDPSYPETTGYICQTFVHLWLKTGDRNLLDRAVAMGDWEVEIQMPSGAVMGGKYGPDQTPAVFNTGMVLLGWAELIRHTGEERFKVAATRASEWLLSVQEPDGNWIRGNSVFVGGSENTYNVKAAWGLCEAGLALDRPDFVQAAVRNAEFCLTRQTANGWFEHCDLEEPDNPLLHTIAYTMQGLVEIGRLVKRQDFIDAARKTADVEISIMGPDGFLPGTQNARFEGPTWACLTGCAQTSIVCRILFELTKESKYREAAAKLNRYVMAHHDIRNTDPRIRGGLAGSWPVQGDYGRLLILNWATKFLVDALCLEKYSGSFGSTWGTR